MHLLNHFSDLIRQLGNPLKACCELPERAMMDFTQVYQQLNCHEVDIQVVWIQARKEVMQSRELNVYPANQRRDDEMPLTNLSPKPMMDKVWLESKTLDDLAEWCAMAIGGLQNYIGWRFKRFADFTDYLDHDWYFSHLNDARYVRYIAGAILVTTLQCDEQAVHIVRCTGYTWWRQHKPPRNDRVQHWMATCSDSQFKATAGRIPTRLKSYFIVEAAESGVKGLLALVQTIATGPISSSAGMVIVEQRHQPLMQYLHKESHHGKPLPSVGTPYIISLSTIESAVHLLPLTPQPESTQWYLSNMID